MSEEITKKTQSDAGLEPISAPKEITGWCVVLADDAQIVGPTMTAAWDRAYCLFSGVTPDPIVWKSKQIALGARCFPGRVVEVTNE